MDQKATDNTDNIRHVYDTNYFVSLLSKNKQLEVNPFFFTDVNLCEWLKGKNIKTQKDEFLKIDLLIKSTDSKYSFRSTYLNAEQKINYYDNFDCRFKIARKIAKCVFKDLLEIYITMCFLIISLIFIKKNGTTVVGDTMTLNKFEDYESARASMALIEILKDFKKRELHNFSRNCFYFNKEEMVAIGVTIFNELVKEVNNKTHSSKLELIETRNFNYHQLITKNHISISFDELKNFISNSISTKNNKDDSIELFVSVMRTALIDNGRMEFNDIADYYLEYIANRLECKYVCLDKRYERISK